MQWTVHGERPVYESEWVRLVLADVEVPDGPRFEHHVVRMPRHAAGAVVTDPQRGVLLIWRHRFITDTWGWEVPGGRLEAGETPAQAAAREVLEETGWRPGPLHPLVTYHPTNGHSDATFHLFVADGAEHMGEPTDRTEAARVEWVPVEQVRAYVRAGEVLDGLSLTALTYALLHGAV